MNNGVNNLEQNNSINGSSNSNSDNNSTLASMAGVKIAPISDEPVNASNPSTATSAYRPNGSANNNGGVSQTPLNSLNTNSNTTSIPKSGQVNGNPVSNDIPVIVGTVPDKVEEKVVVQKKKSSLPLILFLLIVLMGFYIYYSSNLHKSQIDQLKYNCTPITSSSEDIKLDVDSNLVKDLYSKVYTNIREDYASVDFNDEMKLYLAFRQIPNHEVYKSNCNLFSNTNMEPYKCDPNSEFVPRAFKVESLTREVKKLYGVSTELNLRNIQLKSYCIGGFQYVKERDEYVEGLCEKDVSVPFKAEKSLVSATSNLNTIVLKEDVIYKQSKSISLPEYLKSGYYLYTFRLDMDYNYVLVSKEYENKY